MKVRILVVLALLRLAVLSFGQKPFVMFADHDEFATFFANTRSNLNRVIEPLSNQGFAMIEQYKRW